MKYLFLALVLTGCTPALVNLSANETGCPVIPIPAPIPSSVYIRILNNQVETNAGGEKLLRQYAGMRTYLKSIR